MILFVPPVNQCKAIISLFKATRLWLFSKAGGTLYVAFFRVYFRGRPCSKMMSARQDRSSVKARHATISIDFIKETPADISLNIYNCILQSILQLYHCSIIQNVFPRTESADYRAPAKCKAHE